MCCISFHVLVLYNTLIALVLYIPTCVCALIMSDRKKKHDQGDRKRYTPDEERERKRLEQAIEAERKREDRIGRRLEEVEAEQKRLREEKKRLREIDGKERETKHIRSPSPDRNASPSEEGEEKRGG